MKNIFNYIIKKSKIGKNKSESKKLQKLKKKLATIEAPPPNIMELNKEEKNCHNRVPCY